MTSDRKPAGMRSLAPNQEEEEKEEEEEEEEEE